VSDIVAVDLGVDVGGISLVSGVNLELRAGTITTLTGPSGAGKSTIAGAIAGTLAATHHISGSVARNVPVGYLPQDAALTLNPARRLGPALGELLILHGDPPRRGRRQWTRRRVDELLAQAAFPSESDERRRYPYQFSGGQRMRLALAQVLATGPQALVLDEPTAGLDPVARAEMTSILDGLRRRGRAILLVTHDETVATELSDQVLTVRDGRLGAPRPLARPSLPRRDRSRSGTTVLEVVGASVRAGSTTMLREATFHVGAGEFVAVVGASGAGKTTLARAIAGLERLSAGQVIVDGEPYPALAARSRRRLARVQYVWQESRESFDHTRPILDQVARTAVRLRGSSRSDARDEALELLESFGLTREQARRTPDDLSGGQLRRIALARALLAHPAVLVCDEPTTGVDPATAASILDHLDRYRRTDGTTVLVCGHDLRLLLPRVDRMIALDRGSVTDDIAVNERELTDISAGLRRLLTADGLEGALRYRSTAGG
jgi:peptide/nickel transport system ATP-binding protein